MLKIDDHDNAVIGEATIWRDRGRVEVLVYDGGQLLDNLVHDGMTPDEALEYIEYNIEGAYVGRSTPVIVWPIDKWRAGDE